MFKKREDIYLLFSGSIRTGMKLDFFTHDKGLADLEWKIIRSRNESGRFSVLDMKKHKEVLVDEFNFLLQPKVK